MSGLIEKADIREITLERTMSYGRFPVYKIIFRNDGTAIYEGKDNVEKIGRYIGEIDKNDFNWLVELINKLNFLDLDDNYSLNESESASVITTVEYDGKRKRVANHAEAGPMELWTIEKVIDGIIFDIYWENEDEVGAE
ncbi:hypothetical protein Q428_07340 [Fervidicella metallireducens AeB]|uniref:DUF6438 domain-containing protein n=1 Tax=Fervidicella metallireducens AeB TaxID=1403537 RepID=A0A017RVA2_9CLOT|nr:DUF6438 domain-containing protein [Fervidicella metallireducens]EYE88582.1 hypothetical protein Q428_07340 [Fervidicella metallireducens AeB]